MSGLAGTGISTTAAASVVQRALAANAAATSSSSGGASGKSNNPYGSALSATVRRRLHVFLLRVSNVARAPPQANNVDVAQAVAVGGRVAAASLAFSQANANANAKSGSAYAPPSLPRRIASNAPASMFASASASEAQAVPGSEVDKLVTRKVGI